MDGCEWMICKFFKNLHLAFSQFVKILFVKIIFIHNFFIHKKCLVAGLKKERAFTHCSLHFCFFKGLPIRGKQPAQRL